MKRSVTLNVRAALTVPPPLFLTLVIPSPLFGQQPPTQSKNNEGLAIAKFRAMIDAINQRARELGLVSVSDEEQTEFYRQRLERQLREDFTKLQSTNIATLSALDHKSLAEITADLKNRATRIKYNVPILMGSGKGDRARFEASPDQLPLMVAELGRLIDSFLNSPIFREASAKDVEFRAKAASDLEGIIALSDSINKAAKRMTKVSAITT